MAEVKELIRLAYEAQKKAYVPYPVSGPERPWRRRTAGFLPDAT